jgi:glycerol-3-phosphate O-acyltransferase / dihydroxyacetone phosphate acyltransferase
VSCYRCKFPLLSFGLLLVPVMRAQDLTKAAPGMITLHDRSQPLQITGSETKFMVLKPGMSIVLPKEIGTAEIASIESDTQCTLKREFRGLRALELLETPGGTEFKVAPKVDQSWVYEKVFERIEEGGCIGIYPEGGSHDRSDLLPLKGDIPLIRLIIAGVAVMALGALQRNPDTNLKIIPCGMNYFHPHKFRSRAVIEFGVPITVPPALVEKYADPSTRREAVKGLLDMIYNALLSVTVNTPDYETLQVVQAARRLYKPAHRRLPLPKVVELNRRFVEGYNHFKDEPRVVKLRKDVLQYNRKLQLLGIRDHQVQNARYDPINVLGKLIFRSVKVTILGLGALPGVVLFGPVFVATKVISHRKAKEALKASSVKLRGRDVLATWKFLVALGLVPLLYFVYGCLVAYYARVWNIFGWGEDSRLYLLLIPLFHFIILPSISFAALRFGEIGMDIYKYPLSQ